jgi:hypothetical protein
VSWLTSLFGKLKSAVRATPASETAVATPAAAPEPAPEATPEPAESAESTESVDAAEHAEPEAEEASDPALTTLDSEQVAAELPDPVVAPEPAEAEPVAAEPVAAEETSAEEAPAEEAPAAEAPAETPADTPAAEAVEEGPFGPGSASPLSDGSAPGAEYTVKGKRSSKLFHTAESPYFGRTKADVWFKTPADAETAGFAAWNHKKKAAAK